MTVLDPKRLEQERAEKQAALTENMREATRAALRGDFLSAAGLCITAAQQATALGDATQRQEALDAAQSSVWLAIHGAPPAPVEPTAEQGRLF